MTRFERATSWTQNKRATKLTYIPKAPDVETIQKPNLILTVGLKPTVTKGCDNNVQKLSLYTKKLTSQDIENVIFWYKTHNNIVKSLCQ